jgi:hypothetical protein
VSEAPAQRFRGDVHEFDLRVALHPGVGDGGTGLPLGYRRHHVAGRLQVGHVERRDHVNAGLKDAADAQPPLIPGEIIHQHHVGMALDQGVHVEGDPFE